MSKPNLNQFLAAMQSEPYDPFWLLNEHKKAREAEDRAYLREKEEQIALCKRVGEQIDKVPVMRVVEDLR